MSNDLAPVIDGVCLAIATAKRSEIDCRSPLTENRSCLPSVVGASTHNKTLGIDCLREATQTEWRTEVTHLALGPKDGVVVRDERFPCDLALVVGPKAQLQSPPKLPRSVITPSSHMNARQDPDAS